MPNQLKTHLDMPLSFVICQVYIALQLYVNITVDTEYLSFFIYKSSDNKKFTQKLLM